MGDWGKRGTTGAAAGSVVPDFPRGFLCGDKPLTNGKLLPGPGKDVGSGGLHADKTAGKYGRKNSGLLAIGPVTGNNPVRVQILRKNSPEKNF